MQMKGFVALADFSVLILRIEPPVVSKAGVQKSVATSKRLSLFWGHLAVAANPVELVSRGCSLVDFKLSQNTGSAGT
jgi:hypothetical protein